MLLLSLNIHRRTLAVHFYTNIGAYILAIFLLGERSRLLCVSCIDGGGLGFETLIVIIIYFKFDVLWSVD